MGNRNQGNQCEIAASAENINGSSENNVKNWSQNQREAQPGEPQCVICGRYAEYICNETDDDICSLECKQNVLSRFAKYQVNLPPPPRLPAVDECFFIRGYSKSDSRSSTIDATEMLRKKLGISVSSGFLPAPVLSFPSLDLPEKLLRNIEVAGYEIPTPVQMQAIPATLSGRSLLVAAETGSGKTASFLIPIICCCAKLNAQEHSRPKKPLAVVISPTRELCIQVEEHAKVLGKGLPFKTALVVGGDSMAQQLHRLEKGASLIVGTPGRLIDLLIKHEIKLDEISILVLDEVDCMLLRGFHEQVMHIIRALHQPQVLMYSATISREVEKMANLLANDVATFFVGKPNKPNGSVKQLAIWVEPKQKKQKLFDIVISRKHFMPPLLVFVASRLGADLLAEAVTITTGVKALSIHGEKPMKERRVILKSFLVGDVPVLVATGVLSRGVDLLGVRQVVLFDMPNSIKEYVHQIGRVSRLGEEGRAIVFLNEENKKLFPGLIEILRTSGADIPKELVNSRSAQCTFSVSISQRKRKHGS